MDRAAAGPCSGRGVGDRTGAGAMSETALERSLGPDPGDDVEGGGPSHLAYLRGFGAYDPPAEDDE